MQCWFVAGQEPPQVGASEDSQDGIGGSVVVEPGGGGGVGPPQSPTQPWKVEAQIPASDCRGRTILEARESVGIGSTADHA